MLRFLQWVTIPVIAANMGLAVVAAIGFHTDVNYYSAGLEGLLAIINIRNFLAIRRARINRAVIEMKNLMMGSKSVA